MKWSKDDLLSPQKTFAEGNVSSPMKSPANPQQPRPSCHLNEEYRADHISAVLKLVTHAEERKFPDLFQRIIMTFFLLSLLRRTTFFSGSNSYTRTCFVWRTVSCG